MKNMMLVHVDIYVSQMEKSLAFYVNQLGFVVREDTLVEGELPRHLSGGLFNSMRLVMLEASRIGAGIELMQFQQPPGSQPFIPNPMSGSISFLISEMQPLINHLANAGLLPDTDPFFMDLPRIGKSRIVLYRDPDRHTIEFIEKIAST